MIMVMRGGQTSSIKGRDKDMRAKKKKRLLKDVTIFVGKELSKLIESEEWTAKEIAQAVDVFPNRITEIRNFPKYERPIGEVTLKKLIRGGFVTVDKIKAGVKTDQEDRRYLDDLRLHENPELEKKMNEVIRMGGDPVNILTNWIKKQ